MQFSKTHIFHICLDIFDYRRRRHPQLQYANIFHICMFTSPLPLSAGCSARLFYYNPNLSQSSQPRDSTQKIKIYFDFL